MPWGLTRELREGVGMVICWVWVEEHDIEGKTQEVMSNPSQPVGAWGFWG